MKTTPTVLMVIVMLFPSLLNAQTTLELRQQAGTESSAADRELNSTYKKILGKLDDVNQSKKRFIEAERLWIKYRDAQIAALWPGAYTDSGKFSDSAQSLYGSSVFGCIYTVDAQLTKIRVKELRNWLAELNGEINGDMCNEEVFGPIVNSIYKKEGKLKKRK